LLSGWLFFSPIWSYKCLCHFHFKFFGFVGFIFKFFLCLLPITSKMLNYNLCDALLLFLHPWSYFPPNSLLWWVHFYKVVSFQAELWSLWCPPLVLTPGECFPLGSLLWWVHFYKVVTCCNLQYPFVLLGIYPWQFHLCTRRICSCRLFWCWIEKCKFLCHLCTLGNFWLSSYGFWFTIWLEGDNF